MDELKQYYAQVSNAISAVKDMTARIDERMKILVEKLDGQEEQMERLSLDVQELVSRVSVLESKKEGVDNMRDTINQLRDEMHRLGIKIAALEIHHQRHDSRWNLVGDFVIKFLWSVAAGVVIYKLGFMTMPIP